METQYLETFAEAVRADRVDDAASLLSERPALAFVLDAPLPGEGFGGLAIGAATRNRSTGMLDLLLSHGADINARSDWWAGGFGVLELCDPAFAPELTARGAAEHACAAARLGDLVRLTQLLDEDSSRVHMRGGDGKTPLHYASTVQIARLLLDRGADIDALDVDHESTPAQYLVSDHPDVARFLITRGCRSDILLASALGAVDLVQRILDETPDVIRTRVTDEWFPKRDPRAGGTIYTWTLGTNKSAYIIAREKQELDVAALLAARLPREALFADLCILGDADSARALFVANPGIISRLGAGDLGLLPNAVFDACTAAVRLMLELGWPVNAANAQGMTALHAAAWHGHANLVGILLLAGADVHAREREYEGTPLDWAKHGATNSWLRARGDYAGVIEQLEGHSVR